MRALTGKEAIQIIDEKQLLNTILA